MRRIAAAGLIALFLAGCNQTVRDLEDVPIQDPQKIELYSNVDQYANIVAICINGEGFVSTTRDYEAIEHIPQWSAVNDGWCASQGDAGPQ
jgi:hypothetical protein